MESLGVLGKMLAIVGVCGFLLFTAWLGLKKYGETRVLPQSKQTDLFAKPFEIISHRGGSEEAPENTFAAFDRSIQVDADIMFELDVRLTKDDEIVVFHDDELQRTTNGTGFVREKLWTELSNLDAGYNFKDKNGEFSYRGKGQKIPRLAEIFERYPKTRMILDVKDNLAKAGDRISDLIDKMKVNNRIVFASEFGSPLQRVQKFFPNWVFGASQDVVLKSVTLAKVGLAGMDPMKADVYSIPEVYNQTQVLTPALLAEAKRRQKKVFIWTVNNAQDFGRLISMGVDGIITDRPTDLKIFVSQKK